MEINAEDPPQPQTQILQDELSEQLAQPRYPRRFAIGRKTERVCGGRPERSATLWSIQGYNEEKIFQN